MKKTINQKWVSRLAEELLCEIMGQMSGIELEKASNVPEHFDQAQLGIVWGETTGDFNIRMCLKAEQALFVRLARNMIGAPPRDQEEVEEYATEFFNIICGRFVSELYTLTGQSARFLPTIYEHPPGTRELHSGNPVNTVKFISDGNEGAIFSWTLASQRV